MSVFCPLGQCQNIEWQRNHFRRRARASPCIDRENYCLRQIQDVPRPQLRKSPNEVFAVLKTGRMTAPVKTAGRNALQYQLQARAIARRLAATAEQAIYLFHFALSNR